MLIAFLTGEKYSKKLIIKEDEEMGRRGMTLPELYFSVSSQLRSPLGSCAKGGAMLFLTAYATGCFF